MGGLKTYGPHFLTAVLLLLFAMSCEEGPEKEVIIEGQDPFAIYLVDSLNETSLSLASEVAMAFDYAKIPFEGLGVNQFNAQPVFSSSTNAVYLNSTLPLDSVAKMSLVRFVAEGGHLILTSLNEDPSMAFLSGVSPSASYEFDTLQSGLKFQKEVLPGFSGKLLPNGTQFIGLKRENFIKNIQILVSTATDESMPVIFEHLVGNGRVVHFNTFHTPEKRNRGLYLALALPALEAVPYSIANIATIEIDDFPNPIYEISAEPIASEMGINSAEYVTDVWWPDMLRISERFNIPYTVYPCFNYDLIKEPPFIFREWDNHKAIRNGKQEITTNWLINEVRRNEFELAFHGYNHEHLTKDVWTNGEYIEGALEAVRKKWTVNAFGAYPISYVPPSNYIDSFGLYHLANAMPEIEFMASTFEGDIEEGGGREFDFDPLEPRLFDFPRVTSGYLKSDPVHYSFESLFLYTGIWTHFIHPDDVYQIPAEDNSTAGDFGLRNGKGLNWYKANEEKPSMFSEWIDFLSYVKRNHPSLRFMKVSNGARLTKAWRAANVTYEEAGDVYSVSLTGINPWPTVSHFWNVYVSRENELGLESELIDQQLPYTKTQILSGSLYTVETEKPELIFPEDSRLMAAPPFYQPEVYDLVISQYLNHEKQKALNVELGEEMAYVDDAGEIAIEDSVAYYVANDSLLAATTILEKRLKSQDSLDIEQFDYFVLYLGYDERSEDIWEYLDETYQNQSHELAYTYLKRYLERESYPNEQLNELWIRRQLLDEPGNKELLDEYLLYFYNLDNKENVKSLILGYHEAINTDDSYALYVNYLIDFEPELIPTELTGKLPRDYPKLWENATTITYLFADDGDIQSALQWSEFSDDIDIQTKLQWWIDLEAYNKMESVYLAYIEENPNDEKTKAFVSNFWYDIGEVERSALVAKTFDRDTTLQSIKGRFNPDVRYFETDVQKYLMIRAPQAVSKDTLELIKANQRTTSHDYISYQTDYVIDNFNQSVWNNMMSYHKRSKGLHEHRLSVTYSDISDIALNNPDINNVPHSLYGLRYTFQTPVNTEKPVIYGTAGLEQDNSGTFFTIGGGYAKSDSLKFFSLGYTFSPVRSGPAISQKIYWSELVGYYERGTNKHWQKTISPVLTHYTFDSGVFEAAATGRLDYNIKPLARSRFSPYGEVFGSVANSTIENGNPFWVVSERYYLGGGFAWKYGNQQPGELYLGADAGAFYDSYTGTFLRLSGTFSFPVKKYIHVNGQFEYFSQDLYYSNGFRFGISYFLDSKKTYTYRPRPYDKLYK